MYVTNSPINLYGVRVGLIQSSDGNVQMMAHLPSDDCQLNFIPWSSDDCCYPLDIKAGQNCINDGVTTTTTEDIFPSTFFSVFSCSFFFPIFYIFLAIEIHSIPFHARLEAVFEMRSPGITLRPVSWGLCVCLFLTCIFLPHPASLSS